MTRSWFAKASSDASKKESYDEVVSVRYWDGKKFIIPVEGVKAFRYEKDGASRFGSEPGHAGPDDLGCYRMPPGRRPARVPGQAGRSRQSRRGWVIMSQTASASD